MYSIYYIKNDGQIKYFYVFSEVQNNIRYLLE